MINLNILSCAYAPPTSSFRLELEADSDRGRTQYRNIEEAAEEAALERQNTVPAP